LGFEGLLKHRIISVCVLTYLYVCAVFLGLRVWAKTEALVKF